MLQFTHPWLLLLLLPAGGLLWLAFRRMRGMAKARKVLSSCIRFALVSLLIIALAGPQAKRENLGTCTVFLLDRSDSIGDDDRKSQIEFVNGALKHLGDSDEAAVVAFGREPQVEASSAKLSSLDRVLSKVDGSSSDLAAAIRLASATFPDGKGRRIVVLSDGNETKGDAADAVAAATTEGISVDYVPLGARHREGEVSVGDVTPSGDVHAGQPYQLRVVVNSESATNANLELVRDGVLVERKGVRLAPGKNSFTFSQTMPEAGVYRYRVGVEAPDDHDRRNNVGVGFVSIKGRPKVLLIQNDRTHAELAQALRKQGINVELYGPEGAPTRPDQLIAYDAVLLNNVNAMYIAPAQQKLLQSAVRDSGIGLAMVGGENSFLPGGWYGTPVAEALPVDLNIRQRKTFPSTSILIICDTSGSMGMIEDGLPKVRLAAKAAEETVRVMSSLDRVGVAASTDGIEFVAPMQKLDNKEAVISQIQRLGVGGGGIYCQPSMLFGEKTLLAESSKVRHLILLGDGSDCDLQEGCNEIAMRMRAMKITTSTVSIGEGPHTPFLKQLAFVGGGGFYLAKKASQLPAIFTQDAALMSRSAIEEGAFMPKAVIGEPILRGISSTPALYGYCLADTRPLTRVGMRTQKDDVLLATWQYGLGTSLAFTSDAESQWARGWVPWSGFGQFWAQAVRTISRRGTIANYSVETRQEYGKGEIVILGKDENGSPVNVPPSEVRVSTPSGESKPVNLTQTGPGEFRASVAAEEIGSYIVTAAEKGGGTVRTASSGFSVPYPSEYRFQHTNEPLLSQLAESSGGQKLADPKDAVRPVPELGFSIGELWSWFVLAAALLLPIDVGVRRVALPLREILAKVLSWRRAQKQRAAEVVVPAHIDRLKGVKRAARDTETPPPAPGTVIAPSAPGGGKAKAGEPASAGSKLLEAKRNKSGKS